MNTQDLARQIYHVAHLTGTFQLRSGQTSHEYFDKYQFEARPDILRAIAEHLAPKLPRDTQILAALEMGGIPVATALSLLTGLPLVFVRKEAKTYGTCKLAEGPALKNQRICVIEDVITTGGQVVISTQELRALGAIVNDVACVIYRGPGGAAPAIREMGLNQINLFTREQLQP